ncbi:glycosyltransferase [Candidatus Dojkabacteria bacterium]|uniref:Glycosyltransferase n=1 Tax=Candidatus Dojkabacteria bacterium TaxID=2099670 RepID=A0A955RHF2_9BACT|nr:glycosyltransferase [Candidatus Dojkabacteria bacterium]
MNKQYTDGQPEEWLYQQIVVNKRKDFDALLKESNEWAVKYHLSPQRGHIVLPFDISGAVLEIGAGLGAISEVLIQKADNLTILELSEHRKEIIKARLNKPKKVSFNSGNLENFKTKNKFDWIVCVGVLEYAGRYINNEDPFGEFIRLCKKLLNPDGKLLIAIENRLGVKYLAGCNEDHYNKKFIGIENYPGKTDVATFNKAELVNLLSANGFSSNIFYYPFPDYKFPVEIHSDWSLEKMDFRSNRLFPSKDNGNSFMRTFDEGLFFQSLGTSEQKSFFANSFLVISHNNKYDSNILYSRYQAEKSTKHRQLTIIRKGTNKIEVSKSNNQIASKPVLKIFEDIYNFPALERTKNIEFIDGAYLSTIATEKIINADIQSINILIDMIFDPLINAYGKDLELYPDLNLSNFALYKNKLYLFDIDILLEQKVNVDIIKLRVMADLYIQNATNLFESYPSIERFTDFVKLLSPELNNKKVINGYLKYEFDIQKDFLGNEISLNDINNLYPTRDDFMKTYELFDQIVALNIEKDKELYEKSINVNMLSTQIHKLNIINHILHENNVFTIRQKTKADESVNSLLIQVQNASLKRKVVSLIRKFKKLFTPTYLRKAYEKGIEIWKDKGLFSLVNYVKQYYVRHTKGTTIPSIQKNFDEYDIWLSQNSLTVQEVENCFQDIERFDFKPLISIIMPVYNVEEEWLVEAIESIRRQIYQNWELCIVDDASTAAHIKPILKRYGEIDPRIKPRYLKKNSHISIASNKGMEIASGEYITYIDNDDTITPNALFEFVKVLNANKNLKFLYSDEDKLEMDGSRVEPTFKPDWSPETILSAMYTTHLSLYDIKIAKEIGGYRKGYEGSQDYDFVLRYTEKIDEDQIFHIPKILYHWRKIPGSTAAEYSVKNYAHEAAYKALKDTVLRRGIKGNVQEGLTPVSFRIQREINSNQLISIIIPTYNRSDLVEQCVNSIEQKSKYRNFEIIIVDNNSDERKSLKKFDDLSRKYTVIKYPKPFNFSAINNFAVQNSKGEQLLFLNNDVKVESFGWLEAMLEYSQLDEIGAVGAKLIYPNDTIQHAGVILGIGGIAGHSHKYFPRFDYGYMSRIQIVQNLSAVTGACLMIKRKSFDEVGGFEEKLAVSFNDVDLCLKLIKQGYRNVYTPYAELYHFESISRGDPNQTPEKQKQFQTEIKFMEDKWDGLIKNDPYYNPNLSLTREDFSFKFT